MKALKSQNAITLIALVITIIVLLILAGVTINLTLGNNGIFSTAQKAAKNYTDAQNKELAELNEFNDTVQALSTELGTIIKTENNINYTADGAGNIIPVPAGFSPITVKEGQGTKETGFVIRNDVDKNEFVWVPVEGMGYTYNRYAFGQQVVDLLDEDTQSMRIKNSSSTTYYYTEKMSSEEQVSVTNYKGYYIGRYEAGIASTTARKEGDKDAKKTAEEIEEISGKAISQAEKYTYNYVTRDQAKGLAERLYTKVEDNVTSKLCSSYAWDTALKFIETKYQEYPINSSAQGNYSGILKTTGQTTAVNNIYDMGGNVFEWTTEQHSSINPCVFRGGDMHDNDASGPASRRNADAVEATWGNVGFRVTLFM